MAEMLLKERLIQISKTVDEVSKLNRNEELSEEEITNSFLDGILDFKKRVVRSTNCINKVVELTEGVTWSTTDDPEILEELKEIIEKMAELHSTGIRIYVKFNRKKQKGIAVEEITNFKHSLDDLKEAKDDLLATFFIFPNDKEFQSITSELN